MYIRKKKNWESTLKSGPKKQNALNLNEECVSTILKFIFKSLKKIRIIS